MEAPKGDSRGGSAGIPGADSHAGAERNKPRPAKNFFSLISMAVGCQDWRPAAADRKEGCNSLPGAAAPTGAVTLSPILFVVWKVNILVFLPMSSAGNEL